MWSFLCFLVFLLAFKIVNSNGLLIVREDQRLLIIIYDLFEGYWFEGFFVVPEIADCIVIDGHDGYFFV